MRVGRRAKDGDATLKVVRVRFSGCQIERASWVPFSCAQNGDMKLLEHTLSIGNKSYKITSFVDFSSNLFCYSSPLIQFRSTEHHTKTTTANTTLRLRYGFLSIHSSFLLPGLSRNNPGGETQHHRHRRPQRIVEIRVLGAQCPFHENKPDRSRRHEGYCPRRRFQDDIQCLPGGLRQPPSPGTREPVSAPGALGVSFLSSS